MPSITIVQAENKVWHCDGACWLAMRGKDLSVQMQNYDGQQYRIRYVRSNTVRIKSIFHELHERVSYHSFFQKAAAGVNCESGIISLDKQGSPNLLEHDLEHRCGYLVQGNWPVDISDEKAEQSLLSSLLKSALFGDVDAPRKIDLVGEVDAAAALGISTRLIQPRALILYEQIAENGKSQILAQMRGIWPTAAVATVSLQKFSDDKYLVQLAGKLLNASDSWRRLERMVRRASNRL